MPNTRGSPMQRRVFDPSVEDTGTPPSASANGKGTITSSENLNRKYLHAGTGSVRLNMAMQRGGTNMDDDQDEEEDLLDDDLDELICENDKRKGKKTATQSLAEFLATSGPEDLLPPPRQFVDEKTKKNRGSLFFRRGKVKNKIVASNVAANTRGIGTNQGKKYVALIPELPLGMISPSLPSPSASKTPTSDANSGGDVGEKDAKSRNADVKLGMPTSPALASQEYANKSLTNRQARSGDEARPGLGDSLFDMKDGFSLMSPAQRLQKSQHNQENANSSSEARSKNTTPEERTARGVQQQTSQKFDRTGDPGSVAVENLDTSYRPDDSLISSRTESGSGTGSRGLMSMLLPPPPTSRPPAKEGSGEERIEGDKNTDIVRRFETKQRGNISENEIARQQVVFEFQQRQRQRQQYQRQQAEMGSQGNLQMPNTQSSSTSPIVRARVAPNKAPRLSLSLTSLGLLGQSTLGDFLSPTSNSIHTSDSTAVDSAEGINSDSTADKAAPLTPRTVGSDPPHVVSLRPSEDVNVTSAIRSGGWVGKEEEDASVVGTADSIDKSIRNAKKVTFMEVADLIKVSVEDEGEGGVEEEEEDEEEEWEEEVDTHQSVPPSSAQRSTSDSTTEYDIGITIASSTARDLKLSSIQPVDDKDDRILAGENRETITRSRSSSTLIDATDMSDVVDRDLATRAGIFRSQLNGFLEEGENLESSEIKTAMSDTRISDGTARQNGIANGGAGASTDSVLPAALVPKTRARKRVRHVQVQTRTTVPNNVTTAATQTEFADDSEPSAPALGSTTTRAEREDSTEQVADLESVLEINRALRLEIAATRAQLAAETRAKQRVVRTMEQTKDQFDALSARAYAKLKEVLGERDDLEEAVRQLRHRLHVHERRETVM